MQEGPVTRAKVDKIAGCRERGASKRFPAQLLLGTMGGVTRREQPLAIRLAHWLSVPLGVVVAASGLQILAAYPYMGPRGAFYAWYPLQGWVAPSGIRLGGWLAGARALHFGVGLLWLSTGAAYVAYLLVSGEWRRRFFWPRRDAGNAWATLRYYLRLGPKPDQPGLYNGLQRAAYTAALGLAGVALLTGLVLYKPVQFPRLERLLGGYDFARLLHLATLAALAGFTAGHLLMVALHPRSLWAMLQGGRRG
jgi:thiosulfate reductase cytochrome b subunit